MKKQKKRKENRNKKFHLKKQLSQSLFLSAPKSLFFFPNSFFHFLYGFGAQKSNFKHSTFIAQGLKELWDLETSTQLVTGQMSIFFLFVPRELVLVAMIQTFSFFQIFLTLRPKNQTVISNFQYYSLTLVAYKQSIFHFFRFTWTPITKMCRR